jgi:hypothetical protein
MSALFLGRFFFFDSDRHKKLFDASPPTFLKQRPPQLFPSFPKIAVLGDPLLTQRIAAALGPELITARDVIARCKAADDV